MRRLATLVIVQLASAATARADEPAPATPAAPAPEVAPGASELHEDKEFGPVILIEAIEITGNTATQTEIIRRALPIQPGDIVHSSDRRLRDTRFKVLALGYF